jgi:hypothetical protein
MRARAKKLLRIRFCHEVEALESLQENVRGAA